MIPLVLFKSKHIKNYSLKNKPFKWIYKANNFIRSYKLKIQETKINLGRDKDTKRKVKI